MPVEALQNSRFCFWLTFVCLCYLFLCLWAAASAFGPLIGLDFVSAGNLRNDYLNSCCLFAVCVYYVCPDIWEKPRGRPP